MRIEVDVDACVAGGQCVLADPDVFDQSEEDGTVVLLDPEPDSGHDASVRQAARLCPASAIKLADR